MHKLAVIVFSVISAVLSAEIYNESRPIGGESVVQGLGTPDSTTDPNSLSESLTTSESFTKSDSSSEYDLVTLLSSSTVALPDTSNITSTLTLQETSMTSSDPVTSVIENSSTTIALECKITNLGSKSALASNSISKNTESLTFVSTSPMTPLSESSDSTSTATFIASPDTSTNAVTSSAVFSTMNIASTMNPATGSSVQLPEDEDLCDTLNTIHKELKARFKKPGKIIRITEEVCDSYLMDKARRESLSVCEQNRVVGGRTVYPEEYLHMGAIGWKAVFGNWIFKCGSTLISDRFVVTAAHCTSTASTEVADPSPKVVRFSDRSIDTEGEVRKGKEIKPTDILIKNIIVHPNYKAPSKYDDIALIELQETLTFRNYPNLFPACIWHDYDTTALGTEATVTGWGADKPELRILSEISPELKVATLDLLDSTKCDELLRPLCNRHFEGVRDTQICAGKLTGGVDSCQGDSGGPLQVLVTQESKFGLNLSLYYIIGVTSFGYKCGLPNTPGVYTRVSAYLDWIEEIVWPEKIQESIDIRCSFR